MRGKRLFHWIADGVASLGVGALGLAAKGALVLGPVGTVIVSVVTGLALKLSRSPVRSAPTEGGRTGAQ